MKPGTLATFNTVGPAQYLQRRLQEEGFKALVHDETKQERFWFMSEPLAAVHVVVDPAEFEAALAKFCQWEETDEQLGPAIHCPACHRSQVEYPQLTRKFLLPSLGALLLKFKIIPAQFYCHSCHYTWSPGQPPPDAPRDVLGFRRDSKLFHPENRS